MTEEVKERAIAPKSKGFFATIKDIFGPIGTKEFWFTVLQKAVQEMVTAMLIGAGNVLVWYGSTKKNREVQDRSPMQGPDITNRAFSSGYAPPPSYPVPPSSGDSRFPGFTR